MSSRTENRAARAVRWAGLSKFLSWLAVAIGAGFVALFLVQAGLFSALLPDEQPPQPELPNPDQITAIESTVNGLDRENQPYTVKAKRGWQDEVVPTLVHLEGIEGQFRRTSGKDYTLVARTGAYDTKVKELDLAGAVTITEKERFTAVMEKAHVVVEDKKLTSDVAVAVTFAQGTITANGMQITDDGNRILFLNGVKARFSGAGAKGDGNP
jgi:lipopolysaccharide export system protein LptC